MGGRVPPGAAVVLMVPSPCISALDWVEEATAAMGTDAPMAEIPAAAPPAPPAPASPTRTVITPIAQTSGGPTQTSISVTRDCGIIPVRTVIAPSTNGPPTWG